MPKTDIFDLTNRIALSPVRPGHSADAALELALAGATIVLNDIVADRLGAAVEGLRDDCLLAHGTRFDVTKPEQVEAAIANVERRLRPPPPLGDHEESNSGGQSGRPWQRRAIMSRRCRRHGNTVLGCARTAATVEGLVVDGATDAGAESLEDLVGNLAKPRVFWVMAPAASVDDMLASWSRCSPPETP